MPLAEAIDDKSGEARFKIVLNSAGVIDSLTVVNSTVSAKQEALCRQALLRARFERSGSTPGNITGFYTFKFVVR
jgi:hypothetical protein